MTANTYGPVWLARYSLDWLMGCRLLTFDCLYFSQGLALQIKATKQQWYDAWPQPGQRRPGWLDAIQATIKETKQALYES